jgi:hypothetical protein
MPLVEPKIGDYGNARPVIHPPQAHVDWWTSTISTRCANTISDSGLLAPRPAPHETVSQWIRTAPRNVKAEVWLVSREGSDQARGYIDGNIKDGCFTLWERPTDPNQGNQGLVIRVADVVDISPMVESSPVADAAYVRRLLSKHIRS